MSIDSCHESRLMKSIFHKKQFYKDSYLWFFIKTMKITAYFVFFMEYESRLIQYYIELVFMSHESRLMKKVYRIHFYESSLNMSVDSWKNTHKTFIELTPYLIFCWHFILFICGWMSRNSVITFKSLPGSQFFKNNSISS